MTSNIYNYPSTHDPVIVILGNTPKWYTCIISSSIIHETVRRTDYSDYYSNVNTSDSTYIKATTIHYNNKTNVKHKVIKSKHSYFDLCSICSSNCYGYEDVRHILKRSPEIETSRVYIKIQIGIHISR